MTWSNRIAWSGEVPLDYPHLNPVAYSRLEQTGPGLYADEVDEAHEWELHTANPADNAPWTTGEWAHHLRLNIANPATTQSRLTLPHFEGLWPSEGRLLMGMWHRQGYTMAFNPLMSTRGSGPGHPLAYLSTYAYGDPRVQVYNAAGSLILDQRPNPPWGVGDTGWLWYGIYLDMDEGTAQLLGARHADGQAWAGPVWSLSGTPNAACEKDLDIFSLQTASYWTGGRVDEIMVAHPGEDFNPGAFIAELARGAWARGQDPDASGKLTVTDFGVTATEAHTLHTGAEEVSWTATPDPSIGAAIPHWSTDGGATWQTGTLPAALTGLLRWEIPLGEGETFTGLVLRPPAPTLAAIPAQQVQQRTVLTLPLTYTVSGEPTWTVAASGVTGHVDGTDLVIDAGWASGAIPVTVTLRDGWNRTATQGFILTVTPAPWAPPPPVQYPRAPIILRGVAGDPEEAFRNVFPDPLAATADTNNHWGGWAGTSGNQWTRAAATVPWSLSGSAYRATWTTVNSPASGDTGVRVRATPWAERFTVACSVAASHAGTVDVIRAGSAEDIIVHALSPALSVTPGVPQRAWMTFTRTGTYTDQRMGLNFLAKVVGVQVDISDIDLYPGDYDPARPIFGGDLSASPDYTSAWPGGPGSVSVASTVPYANDEAILDARRAIVTEEVNGELSLEFSIPRKHRHAGAIVPERAVELAGELYRIRRITTGRDQGVPVVTAYCEADFYDLAFAGQIDPREYLQTPAGAVMEEALAGTGWTVGAVTVTTRRTYAIEEETNPLALLRTVQQQHGGDLVFDSHAKTVSLVTQSGRDVGVTFFYSRGLTDSKCVIDTTSLVTRIYARNADGATIASVNDGLPYVEDFTWTEEVREATYDFASGTSPWTMLTMSQATLANRSKPSFSYEFTVADLSHRSSQDIDRFGVGDTVTVVDDELGIRETQRIIRAEHDVVRPWASRIVLSGKLRELGSRSSTEAGALSSGTPFASFDLVPFNLLRNGRFDNGLAHWAASGVAVVDGEGTGDRAVRFEGAGTRWIEQTVHPDRRDVYSLSLDTAAVTGGAVPPLTAIVTVEYEDGTSEVIPVELA